MKELKKHNAGFKVPDSYFDVVENQIQSQIYLDSLKNSSFKIPKDYFDNFEVDLNDTKSKPKLISLLNKKNVAWVSGIAATIVLLFSLNFNTKTTQINSLANESLEQYLVEEINYIDFGLLANDLQVTETDFINLDTNNIIDYLDDVEVDDLIQN